MVQRYPQRRRGEQRGQPRPRTAPHRPGRIGLRGPSRSASAPQRGWGVPPAAAGSGTERPHPREHRDERGCQSRVGMLRTPACGWAAASCLITHELCNLYRGRCELYLNISLGCSLGWNRGLSYLDCHCLHASCKWLFLFPLAVSWNLLLIFCFFLSISNWEKKRYSPTPVLMLSRITAENESWELRGCGEKGRPDQKGKENSPLNADQSIHFLRTATTTH